MGRCFLKGMASCIGYLHLPSHYRIESNLHSDSIWSLWVCWCRSGCAAVCAISGASNVDVTLCASCGTAALIRLIVDTICTRGSNHPIFNRSEAVGILAIVCI